MTDRNVADYIAALLAAPKLARQVTCHKVLEERPATFAECARPWPKAIRGVLHEAGIPSLYSHQARAADLIRAGRDVVVTFRIGTPGGCICSRSRPWPRTSGPPSND